MSTDNPKEPLDPYERWARKQLSAVLGPMTVVDVAGGKPGQHDFEATLPAGGVAAVEVTSVVDADRRNLSASITKRRLGEFRVEGSQRLWLVGLLPSVEVRSLSENTLGALIEELEVEGRNSVSHVGHYNDPWVNRLGIQGIESVHGLPAKAGSEGLVFVRAGTYGGVGWDQGAIDEWLAAFLVGPQGANKLEKLGRARGATEKHLVVVLDGFSEPGMGISLALTTRRDRGSAGHGLPSITPPGPLTHLWLIPDAAQLDGLLWTRAAGWQVLSPVPFPE